MSIVVCGVGETGFRHPTERGLYGKATIGVQYSIIMPAAARAHVCLHSSPASVWARMCGSHFHAFQSLYQSAHPSPCAVPRVSAAGGTHIDPRDGTQSVEFDFGFCTLALWLLHTGYCTNSLLHTSTDVP